MPLRYYPKVGEILVCHFPPDAPPPEMRKSRPVVVVGPRLRRRGGLATVVPLSTTAPEPPETYHCSIELAVALPAPFDALTMWAKCDMIAVVSLDRLDRFKLPRKAYGGARQWVSGAVTDTDIARIRAAVLAGLGIKS